MRKATGVFDENDGYVDTPKAVAIKLSNGDEFCVEFHPGDTIYYINDIQIGCTGSSYMIRNISLAQFYEYISNMNGRVKKREFFIRPFAYSYNNSYIT